MVQRIAYPWPFLPQALYTDGRSLKSICIDVIQGHYRYYDLTGRALYGGNIWLMQQNLTCYRQPGRAPWQGALLALDDPPISDPILLASCTPSWEADAQPEEKPTPRDMIQVALTSSESQALRYGMELRGILFGLTNSLVNEESGHRLEITGDRCSGIENVILGPAPFEPCFFSIGKAWIQPLWRCLAFKRTVARLPIPLITYEEFMDVIRRDAGAGRPASGRFQLTPAFECLVHIKCVKDLKRAVVDIAKALTQFGAGDAAFSALTPNRMLFQERTTGVVGFVLDLDPLEEPSKIATYAGPYKDTRALRLAPYDLIATSTWRRTAPRIVYPRHVLESLFNSLVWFYFSNEFTASDAGLFPCSLYPLEEHWFDPKAFTLPLTRTGDRWERFIEQRDEFFSNWKENPNGWRSAGTRALAKEWVVPLWQLIRKAHQSAGDSETLGGHFTVKKFMKILAPARA
ncbi:hypothetical protein FB451DRAFT_1269074 [Mycena latifolia]|nr:hypothetical protein FB451DRAFT_1269074 [Mycena latifolia]